MPLLPPEPFAFPDTLLADAEPAEGPGCWWALHTRPRAEKALCRQLLRRSVAYFLPVYQRRWRDRGRLLSSYLPLFPGYVFLWGEADARVAALETNQVANVLPVVDQERLHADLVRVRQLMDAGAPLAPEQKLEPGDPVEIVAGPLAGLGGTVLRRGRRLHFVVEVRLLQQGVSVEIESWMVRPATTGPRLAASCRAV
jgi:transcriptional antiterminator RfaH